MTKKKKTAWQVAIDEGRNHLNIARDLAINEAMAKTEAFYTAFHTAEGVACVVRWCPYLDEFVATAPDGHNFLGKLYQDWHTHCAPTLTELARLVVADTLVGCDCECCCPDIGAVFARVVRGVGNE